MQWKDKHTKRAFKEGYRARSVYKLEELDKKYEILNKTKQVIDLGCHPGSWLAYIAKKAQKVFKNPPKEKIIEALKQYKQDKSQENFEKLVKILKL